MLEGLFSVYTETVLKFLVLKAGHRWGKYDSKGIFFLPSTLSKHENPIFDDYLIKIVGRVLPIFPATSCPETYAVRKGRNHCLNRFSSCMIRIRVFWMSLTGRQSKILK